MQSAAEVFIGTAIADEAGVELEGLIEQRGQIVNQCVWQTTTAEKGQGERPGLGEGAMVEGARTMVGFQALTAANVR